MPALLPNAATLVRPGKGLAPPTHRPRPRRATDQGSGFALGVTVARQVVGRRIRHMVPSPARRVSPRLSIHLQDCTAAGLAIC